MPDRTYMIRYGRMGFVSPFRSPSGAVFGRGQAVVVRSLRGLELGEVLAAEPASLREAASDIVRTAEDADLALAERLDALRPYLMEVADRTVAQAVPEVLVVEVEPLLDGSSVVVYLAADDQPDWATITDHLRRALNRHVLVEQFGAPPEPAECGTGGCGSGDCGSGGCGSTDASGCDGCAIKSLLMTHAAGPRAG